jgi:predicted RNA methylase
MVEAEDVAVNLDQWLTPPGVASEFLRWSNIDPNESLLEPSAGEGSLIPYGHSQVLAVDIDPERLQVLQLIHPQADVLCMNFLELEPPLKPYLDVSLLNPPFSNGGEGTFLERSLCWAHRACALVRADALHGKFRYEACWSKDVSPVRIAYLVHRPRFRGPYGLRTPHPPKYDYVAIEAVRGPAPKPTVEWVRWR